VGHEETYAADVHDAAALEREAVRLSDAVGARLRRHGLAGRTVQLKVRFGDFRTITRATTLPQAVDTGTEVARAAKALLGAVDPSPGVRLLGVSVSGLAEGPVGQLALDDADVAPWRDATRALDDVRARFGEDAIGPAALVGADGLRPRRRGDQQWGPATTGPGGRRRAGDGPAERSHHG
jgi:DNA polymerase-4